MKLLEQVRQVARVKHLAYRTEQCYAYWITRYIRHHGIKHPNTMGTPEAEQFLTHLTMVGKVSASTHNQALAALLFLFRDVRNKTSGSSTQCRHGGVPIVLSQTKVRAFLEAVDSLPTTEPYGLMMRLMYGVGLRLMECCRLRMKDIDLRCFASST